MAKRGSGTTAGDAPRRADGGSDADVATAQQQQQQQQQQPAAKRAKQVAAEEAEPTAGSDQTVVAQVAAATNRDDDVAADRLPAPLGSVAEMDWEAWWAPAPAQEEEEEEEQQQQPQQQGTDGGDNNAAAAAAAPGRQHPPPPLQPELRAALGRHLAAALKPSADGCWTFLGAPMPRDEVLVHYGRRRGLFQDGLSTAAQLRALEAAPEPTHGSEQVALFHFAALQMTDADEGEAFSVALGDYVIIGEDVRDAKGNEVKEEYVGRVTEIFVTARGRRLVRIHWMYRDVDTPLAAVEGERSVAASVQLGRQRVLPIGGHVGHERRLWLCGSDADNDRYECCYGLESIDRRTNVFHVRPGVSDPSEAAAELAARGFNPATDFWYNQYTVRDFMTFEDCYEDWLPWSPAYRRAWREGGVAGVARLRGGRDGRSEALTALMRGTARRQLPHAGKERTLYTLELFAGGGGLSYICQRGARSRVLPGWANDINNSAAATYTANHPDAYMSCVGLEEYTQLCIKWGRVVDSFLGPNWADVPAIQRLRAGPPQHRYSRQHMPRGVGCFGTTFGAEGSSADLAPAAAREGQAAVDALRAARRQRRQRRQQRRQQQEGADDDDDVNNSDDDGDDGNNNDQEEPEPDWEAILAALPAAADGGAPSGAAAVGDIRPPDVAGLPADKRRVVLDAFAAAADVQRARIEQCRAANRARGRGEVLEVRDVRVTDCAVRVKQGSSRNQVEEGLTEWECWLEFEVRRARRAGTGGGDAGGGKGGGDKGGKGGGKGRRGGAAAGDGGGGCEWAWEHVALLSGAVAPVRRFVLRMLADRTIPLPGDVQLLTGGPPCQNVSGLNRHARQNEVLDDPKNRLVTSYMAIIAHLKPGFILMEQVTDVFKKEAGIYARYALMQMLSIGYQARAGVCTAGHYGVPQGRRRALFWGARAGEEQLPPLPAATHHVKPFHMPYPQAADYCRVEFESEAAARQAYPMATLGDVLGDLPPVANFEEGDRRHYLCEPRHVLQAYLRRRPPPHGAPAEERCRHADGAMAAYQQLQRVAAAVLEGGDVTKILAVGSRVLCRKGDAVAEAAANANKAAAAAAAAAAAKSGKRGGKGKGAAGGEAGAAGSDDGADEGDEDDDAGAIAAERAHSKNFANESWLRHVERIAQNPAEAEALNLVREAELHATSYVLGERRLRLLAAAAREPADAPLRDHRPLLCNADDYGRMAAVPREKGANFRDMPGVMTHGDRTCCAGSWHAAKYPAPGRASAARIAANVAAWRAMTPEQQAAVGDPISVLYRDVPLVSPCAAGGMPPKPPRGWTGANGNDKHFRVDSYGSAANGAWRGARLPGCPSATFWLSTGDVVCPRWCVTYKEGKSSGRHGCFGRAWHDEIQPTVVTRAEPHNLALIHPEQDRVLTVRENARCQGFPDHHVFVGLGGKGRASHGKGAATVDERYLQVGNAVAPPLAAALGRCLLLAAEEAAPVAVPVVRVPDPEYNAAAADCAARGVGHWSAEHAVDLTGKYHWTRHLSRATTPAPSRTGGGGAGSSAAAAVAAVLPSASVPASAELGTGADDSGGGGGGGAADDARAGTSAGVAVAAAVAAAARAAARPPKKPRASKAPHRVPPGAAATAASPPKQPPPPPSSGRPQRGAALAAATAIWDQAQTEAAPTKRRRLGSVGPAAGAAAAAAAADEDASPADDQAREVVAAAAAVDAAGGDE